MYLQLRKEEEDLTACPRSSRSRKALYRNTEEMDAKALQKQARGGNASESHLGKELSGKELSGKVANCERDLRQSG